MLYTSFDLDKIFMKAIAFNINSFEKETLILENHKKHEITFIAERLTPETAVFVGGKEVLLVFPDDVVDAAVALVLKDLGVKYIASTSDQTEHIDRKAAGGMGLKISHVPKHLLEGKLPEEQLQIRMEQVVKNLDLWGKGKCVGKACACLNSCAKKTGI